MTKDPTAIDFDYDGKVITLFIDYKVNYNRNKYTYIKFA